MGREIRRVPADWEHPRDEKGLIPMHDRTWSEACADWWSEAQKWQSESGDGLTDFQLKIRPEYPWYWQYDEPPNADHKGDYRPAFDSEPTHLQMYQNVSEGTPVSPVFATLQELEDWLVADGVYPADSKYSEQCSREAARAFCQSGWAPSGMIVGGQWYKGLEGPPAAHAAEAKADE